jgi:hypothetical protein
MPAAKAGIGPGMKLVAVNGHHFSVENLSDGAEDGTEQLPTLSSCWLRTPIISRFTNSTITAEKNIRIWCGTNPSQMC